MPARPRLSGDIRRPQGQRRDDRASGAGALAQPANTEGIRCDRKAGANARARHCRVELQGRAELDRLPRTQAASAPFLVLALLEFGVRQGCIQGARFPSARRVASTARSTSVALVCQLQTETRMERLPRHVVPPKNASPLATMRAMISSVRRSWSCSVAPGLVSMKRTKP